MSDFNTNDIWVTNGTDTILQTIGLNHSFRVHCRHCNEEIAPRSSVICVTVGQIGSSGMVDIGNWDRNFKIHYHFDCWKEVTKKLNE